MKWVLSINVCLLVFACDKNPFSEEERIPERKITGKVTLQSLSDNSDTYIWLEGTAFLTQTEVDGSFSISLPTPGEAGRGAIVSGSYRLYFYAANYKLKSISIEFLNGEIVEDKKIIDKNGSLQVTHSLENILTLDSKVFKMYTESGDFDSLKVNVTLDPNKNIVFIKSLVKVVIKDSFIRTGYIIFNSDQEFVESFTIDGARIREEAVVMPRKEWQVQFAVKPANYPPGSYTIIPYITLNQSDIPSALESLIGTDHKSFNQNFILYPFKRTGGKFIIQ